MTNLSLNNNPSSRSGEGGAEGDGWGFSAGKVPTRHAFRAPPSPRLRHGEGEVLEAIPLREAGRVAPKVTGGAFPQVTTSLTLRRGEEEVS